LVKLKNQELPMLDYLLQFYGGDIPEQRKQLYLDQISQIKPGVTELIIHCGVDNEELRHITNSAARRDQDRQIFTDPKTAEFIAKQGVKTVSWKELHRRARSKSSP
jgi:chitin disaccharide deacetylase